MEPAQEAKLLSALESAEFETALHRIPTGTPALSLVRLGPNKLTPLHYACQHGRLDFIRSLVAKYPHDVQLLSEGTCSPLHMAAKYGQFESAKFLVEKKLFNEATVNAFGTNTPLHIAAEEGHINIVALLVEKNVCKANAVVNREGDSPLHIAAACNQLSTVKYFTTQTDCDPTIKNIQNSKTPLHLAAEKGYIDIVKYLIEEQHCDPSCTDEDGNTPLHLAAGKGQMHVVQYLITEKHCHPICSTTAGRTPLHVASHNGHLSVVQYLVTEHHCTPSCTDNKGITPLHLASQEGHLDVAVFLSENDSNTLFIADSDGYTPLHTTAKHGNLRIVDCLIKYACDPAIKNSQNGITPLHLAAEQGHLHVAQHLIEEQHCDPSSTDAKGKTPLYLAAGNGKLHVVQFLILEKKCNPMHGSTEGRVPGRTPLHNACFGGHFSVVKYLVNECGSKPSCSDEDGVTPLHLAARQGHLKLVEFLIEDKHCNPMHKSTGRAKRIAPGRTPLHGASFYGHFDVVQYLVNEQKCNPSISDEDGYTPLHLASQEGHLEIVKFFIEEQTYSLSAWLTISNPAGRTPLHSASIKGQIEVMKFLIEEKFDPMYPDEYNWTPLHLAASNGHSNVLQFLMEEKQCDPMCKTRRGRTPLHFASQNGHLEVVKYLVRNDRCDPMCIQSVDNYQWYPLHFAALNEHAEIVQYFVEEKKCDPMCKTKTGRTPLHLASQYGHLEVVKYLVRNNITCDPMCMQSVDKNQWYPLHFAALNGHVETVRFLVEEKQCDPMCKTKKRRTPFHLASQNGHLEVVKYLVQNDRCDPKCIQSDDQYQYYPLHYAALNGHIEIVQFLVEEKQCDPMCKTKTGSTPLHLASQKGHLEVVKYLTEDARCDSMCLNEGNWCAVHFAALNGHTEIVRWLIEEKQYNPMCAIKSGHTPLHIAAEKGHLEVVKYLVQNDRCDPKCIENDGQYPLHFAAANGHTEMVQFLIEEKQCDPMCKTKTGRTPLHLASHNGHLEVVKYLIDGSKCDLDNPMILDNLNLHPLHLAAVCGNVQVVRFFVEEQQCHADCKDVNGYTPLYLVLFKLGKNPLIKMVEGVLGCENPFKTALLSEMQNVLTSYQEDHNIMQNLSTLHDIAPKDENDLLEIISILLDKGKSNPLEKPCMGQSALHIAVISGHLEAVKLLATSPTFDSLCRDIFGQSLLHYAVYFGHTDVLKFLVSKSSHTALEGNTAIHTAAHMGQLDTVKFLSTTDPMCKNEDGRTPLHCAIVGWHIYTNEQATDVLTAASFTAQLQALKECHRPIRQILSNMVSSGMKNQDMMDFLKHSGILSYQESYLEIVEFLVNECNCDPFKCGDKHGRTPFHYAANLGYLEAFVLFSTIDGFDPMCVDYNGRTALHFACGKGHNDIIHLLLGESEVDPMCPDENDLTPLHLAASNGHDYVVQFLVEEKQCDPVCTTKRGHTPLHMAAEHGHLEVVKYLTEDARCDSMCLDEDSWCAVHLAALNGHTEIVRWLIEEKQCDPLCTTKRGHTPLHMAAQNGHTEIVQFLVKEKQCDPMCVDYYGVTALHLACRNCHSDIIHLLSESEVDLMCQDKLGITPLHVAAIWGQDDIVKFLVNKRNYDPAHKGMTGFTPLHAAAFFGQHSVVKALVENYFIPITTNDFGYNPLHYTVWGLALKNVIVSKEFPDILKSFLSLMITCKDTTNLDFKLDMSELKECIAKGSHSEVIRLLLNVPNTAVTLNCKATDGTTPLHSACFLGQDETIKLINKSGNIDFMVTDNNGLCPLHYALVGRDCLERRRCNDLQFEDECIQNFIQMSHDLKNAKIGDVKKSVRKFFSLLLKYSDSRDYLSICEFLMKECHLSPFTSKDEDGNTPLHYAAWMNDAEAFKLLAGEDIYNSLCCNNRGVTTLHIASGNGNAAIVKFLVPDCKVQRMCQCEDGTTPLHWASETEHLDIIKILASQMPGNYLDQRDSSGRSALFYAVARGQLSVLRYFIEELNCDPFCQDHAGSTILHYASLRGFTDIVQYLLTTLSWSGVLKNKSGSTPLHLAAWKGHLRIVQLLTDPACQHTSTNTAPESDTSGNTPIHLAASEGHKEIVCCLAGQKDFDINCTTASGNTALHDACRKGHLDIVMVLVDSPHCNIVLANNIGATPLHLSVAFGHEDIVQILCSKQSYSQFCSTVYWTPLHMVCCSGLEKNLALRIAQILLDQDSCDPSCTYNGAFPLHLASNSENLNLVKFLVYERGCDPMKPDDNGKLAIHYAVKGQSADVVDFLISCNPESIMYEDHMGKTPLMDATFENIVTNLLLNGADPRDIRIELSDKMSYLNNYVHLRGRRNVYIVGNQASGKSTLVSALESEHKGYFERFAKLTVSRDRTPGINSSVYEQSKCFGPVVFHDFAGEAANYCGHPALLKHSGKPIFIIITNLTDPLVDIKNQISYWLQWVSNVCSAAACHSSVIIVGSHKDRLKPLDLREKDLYLQKLPVSDEVTLSHTTVLGGTTLNCQRIHSTGMSQLRKMLQEVCIASQNVTNIHSMLLAFTKYTFTTPIQLSSVQACITENEIPLPQLLEDLYELYQDLDSSGHIVLLGNENTPGESWIALDQKRILHVVNKFLQDAREHPQYNSTGVVPFSELVAWFGDQFHPDFISKYLVRIEVCQQCFLHSKRCYFFPVLLDAMPNPNLWSFNPRYEQYFGWCLRTKPHKFFPVKFLHALFLELAFTFVLPSPKHVEKDCYIWKNGIRWFHIISGTEVVVQFCEQNTTATIMARCKKGHELKYYEHRSEVLKIFIDICEEFCLKSVTNEYILHPHDVSKYQFSQPIRVSNLKRFDVSEIAKNLISGISLVHEDKVEKSTQKRDLSLPDTEVQDLLQFDPFLGIQTETLQALFSDTTGKITHTFLQCLLDNMYMRWKNLEVLAEIFGCHIPYTPPVMSEGMQFENIMKELLDRKETVEGLYHRLHQYSIFCGRNILGIANSIQLPDTVTEPSQVDPWFLTSDIRVPVTRQNSSMLEMGLSSTTSRDRAATPTAQIDTRVNWEYWTIFRAQDRLIRALADNRGLCNALASVLKAKEIIGPSVYDQAIIHAPHTTEYMRVEPLIMALLSKVKDDPQRYYDFIQILQSDGICQDAEAALKLLPTVNPADDIASSDTETSAKVKDDEVVSQSDHRPVTPIWKLANSTPLDVAELSDIRSELIHDVTEWFPLGLALGLDSPTLEKIQHNNQGQVDKCMADMLDAWLRQKGHIASWQTLAEALSQPTVNKVALANRIATTYTSVSPETLVGLVH